MTRITLLFSSILLSASGLHAQEPRQLDFRITGLNKDTVYLANYYGNRLYYADTAVADAKGDLEFNSPKGYRTGVYAVVIPGPKYFEFILDEPKVKMETDASDLVGKLNVLVSEENKAFVDYIHYLNDQKRESDVLKTRLESTSDPIAKATIKADLEKMDVAVKQYQKDLIAKNEGRLVAKIVRMSMAVELEKPRLPDGSVDSVAAYYQYRDHFWDNVDLTDARLVRTPVFQNKLEEYIGAVVPQIPDTINALADDLIGRLGPDPELYKFVVHNITYKYETSEIMGMDAVFTHMALMYYCPAPGEKSKAVWMSEEKLDKMCERARKMAPLVIGAQGRELILTDSTEQHWISSHKLPQEYVVLCFWDPHCGHCKKELPVLYTEYKERLKALDVEVYAVAKATDSVLFSDWKKYIHENGMDWVNVGLTWHVFGQAKQDASAFIPRYTNIQSLNYAETYDVYSTPKVFVLDGDRKIVGKQLAPDQIADLIERLREMKKAKSEQRPPDPRLRN